MNKFKDHILDLLFPKFCIGCQKEGAFLCEDCRGLLDIVEKNYCLCDSKICLPAGRLGKCPKCSEKRLAGLYFALSFKDISLAKKLIYQFKYPPYLKGLAKTLAGIIIEHLVLAKNNTEEIWQNAVLIPVPLDKKKLKTRGYNQSEELAKELSKVLQVPVLSDVLIKIKQTKSQMSLSKADREKNLAGAFTIKNQEKISNKKIFLVDDVYTTGSTMSECAKILRKSGAKSVWGICIAREE